MDYEIAYENIRDVRLLDSFPEDDYRRINGGEDSKKMPGRFKGEHTRKCRIYIYIGYAPILEIDTADGPVYLNSKDGQETQEWMEQISKKLSDFS
ncbi:hypothetical protein [Mediterraneibacter massiliensis]|uniref:hypothetical protein n=1 Tax=Mediterraneibacter massiliensis TaxID=1720300 RepID=UPI0024ADFF8C|nr:hypothetical protein [Mediterraneibacter massiliensis]